MTNHITQDLLPIIIFIGIFIIPIGGYFVQRNVDPRLMIFLGAIVMFPCLFIASFMTSFTPFAILYVIAFAWNQGMVYLAPIHHGWLWFPDHPGLVSGIIIGGFGVGALVYDNVWTALINPYNDEQDKETGPNAGDVRRQIRNMDMYTKKQRRMLILQEKVANRSQRKVIANSKR